MKTPLLPLIFIALTDWTWGAGGKVKVEKTEAEKLCIKESRRALKQIVRNMGVCNGQMKNATKNLEEHATKMACVVKCILDKENILDERQLVTDETIERAIANRTTGPRRVLTVTKFKSCKEKFGADLDPKDEFCKSYAKFGHCIQSSIADLCNEPPPM